jgi:protease I
LQIGATVIKNGKHFWSVPPTAGELRRKLMKLQGKKIIVLVEDLYQELEAWYPVLRMREEGAEVAIVGTEAGVTYKSKGGYPITSDVASRDIDVNEYDGIIIPGGYAPDLMRRHPATVQLVKDGFEQGKVVAAICHAGWMLTSADVVKGRRVTGFFAIRDDLVHAGAEYEDAEVVVDGTLITSRKPDDLPAFCREIIGALA